MTGTTQPFDIEAWRRDGRRLWEQIQESKLVVIFWRNPWLRFAVLGAALLLIAVVILAVSRNLVVSGFAAALSAPFVFTAAKYYSIGVRTGGLYTFFSDKGFGVGCDADRLCIPYSAIRLPDKISPATVNENYIVLPVRVNIGTVIIERKTGSDSPWDGSPYRRGIVSVYAQNGTLCVRAYPNEMIVHFFCAIYPLSVYLTGRDAQHRLA